MITQTAFTDGGGCTGADCMDRVLQLRRRTHLAEQTLAISPGCNQRKVVTMPSTDRNTSSPTSSRLKISLLKARATPNAGSITESWL